MTDSVQVFDAGFRVLDANGNPVNNAKIKFREIGPGATKPVYSDQGLSTSLGHTVRTRSDGFPCVSEGNNTTTLIFVGSGLYHIEITDEFDVAIFPAKDNVKGAIDTSVFVAVGSTSVLVEPVLTKAIDFTLTAAEKGKVIDGIANGGFITQTLPDPTVVGDGWNITIRNGGTANPVGISSSAAIHTPMGDTTAFSLRLGESVKISCNGSTFKVTGYTPPLINAATGIIVITDRVSSAPVGPVAGARYIVTAPFSTFEAEDIIEATGQGTFIEITPVAGCGWIAYVVDEDTYWGFIGSAWAALITAPASQADMEDATSVLKAVVPGRQHFHPGHPKCWAHVTVSGGTPTLAASFNITSITDTATGRLTITIATDFSSANWACIPGIEADNGASGTFAVAVDNATRDATSVILEAWVVDDTALQALTDPTSWSMVGFGDQA